MLRLKPFSYFLSHDDFGSCATVLDPKPILCNVLIELCAIPPIRDHTTACDIACITDIIAVIEDICTN